GEAQGPVGQIFVPIFPLPDLTFFPHTMLPLHIFEGRYRAMVTDCLARDKRMAVVGLKPGFEDSYEGKPPVYAVAGVGRILRWDRLAHGRYNIPLTGDPAVRQRLLEELDIEQRLGMLATALDDLYTQLTGDR